MPNMNPKKTQVSEQESNIRNKNFNEVILGYTLEEAMNEANRCLNCKSKPCVSGCPVNINIPKFIGYIKEGNIEEAYKTIISSNLLPSICGRVCPQETQCEAKCVRGIKSEPVAIGLLERFVADWYMENKKDNDSYTDIEKNNYKVAIVGSGPSGLVCAGQLAKKGYDVTIFEALHAPGGVLSYGIPEFRLPKYIVDSEINNLRNSGVKIKTNVVIGKTLTIDDLFNKGYKAIYIGIGAGLPKFMGIRGENLIGVYSSNEFLTRINLMKAYKENYDTPIIVPKNVAVIGGGNVAIDASRCAKRLGAQNVYIIYRRSENEMPARIEEVRHAKEEGIKLKVLTNPIEIIGNEHGVVKGIKCVKMSLGEPDETGRRRPIAEPNSEHIIDVDTVIIAIGNAPNKLIYEDLNTIETDDKGCIIVDDNLKTTQNGVYAGGDIVTGAATVILAMSAGKKAAVSIDNYIKSVFA